MGWWQLVHDGKSRFTQERFLVMANMASDNRKLARRGNRPAIGVYIITDVEPRLALQEGLDKTVCGTCSIHDECYVNPVRGPLAAWQAWLTSTYEPLDLDAWIGRFVRLGEYGEPTLIPLPLTKQIVSRAQRAIGYTHQWRERWAQKYRPYLMASVETDADAKRAKRKGWRYFRVRDLSSPIGEREFICPSDSWAVDLGLVRRKITCDECGACDGASRGAGRASPVIIKHGFRTGKRGVRN